MTTELIENHTYIDGHKIAFREQGEGSPVILIHGIPTNSLMWRAIIPKLAGKHRVIAPDLLNYGQSDKPTDANVSIDAQRRIIVQFMDALGVRRADVVAHDIGGGVALLIAVNYPEKVRKLVLIDSVCFDSWPIPEFEPLQEADAESEWSLADFVDMMRGFMPNGVHNKAAMTDDVIGIIRIFVGMLILSTGVMKFVSPMLRTAWSGQLIVANIPFYTLSFWLVPIVEIVIGSLLVVGFFSRVDALIVLSTMVVATYVHLIANDPSLFPLQPSEPIIPLTLIVLSVMILWRGGGAWSIDGKSASA